MHGPKPLSHRRELNEEHGYHLVVVEEAPREEPTLLDQAEDVLGRVRALPRNTVGRDDLVACCQKLVRGMELAEADRV